MTYPNIKIYPMDNPEATSSPDATDPAGDELTGLPQSQIQEASNFPPYAQSNCEGAYSHHRDDAAVFPITTSLEVSDSDPLAIQQPARTHGIEKFHAQLPHPDCYLASSEGGKTDIANLDRSSSSPDAELTPSTTGTNHVFPRSSHPTVAVESSSEKAGETDPELHSLGYPESESSSPPLARRLAQHNRDEGGIQSAPARPDLEVILPSEPSLMLSAESDRIVPFDVANATRDAVSTDDMTTIYNQDVHYPIALEYLTTVHGDDSGMDEDVMPAHGDGFDTHIPTTKLDADPDKPPYAHIRPDTPASTPDSHMQDDPVGIVAPDSQSTGHTVTAGPYPTVASPSAGFIPLSDLYVPSTPLPLSSPVPSSSPPNIFTSPGPVPAESPPSSPTRPGWHDIPTDVSEEEQTPSACSMGTVRQAETGHKQRGKRSFMSDENTIEKPPKKRVRYEPPNTKRPTPAFQRKQHMKLSAPFRSPILSDKLAYQGITAVYSSGRARHRSETPKREPAQEVSALTAETTDVEAKKDYTDNAGKQFKSPLILDTSRPSSAASQSARSVVSSVQAVPTIRNLQGKIQTLKQAIKIQNIEEEDKLEELIHKWTIVGREAAWAVWDTVKDLDTRESMASSSKRAWLDEEFGSGAGKTPLGDPWGVDGRSTRPFGYESGSSSSADPMDDGDDDGTAQGGPTHTLGTMLRHLGIAPETLGWDEDERDFVDM